MNITVDPVVFSNPMHRSQWYAIRTEATVHAACRNPVKKSKVTVEQHRLWWEESEKSKDRMLYFICKSVSGFDTQNDQYVKQVQTVGIVRVDHRGTWMEVWLAIKPESRQQGIATRALDVLSLRARERRWLPLGAVVSSKKNMASWRLFMKAGFVPMKDGFVQLIQKGRIT